MLDNELMKFLSVMDDCEYSKNLKNEFRSLIDLSFRPINIT